jgi:hypothetical protein
MKLAWCAALAALVFSSSAAQAVSITFNPSEMNFGTIDAGPTGVSKNIVLTLQLAPNERSPILQFTKNVDGPFSIPDTYCFDLSCTYPVTFKSLVEGEFKGLLELTVSTIFSFECPDGEGGITTCSTSVLNRAYFNVSGTALSSIPIPAALPLFATGVAAVAYAGRRKRKVAQAAA